MKDELCAINVHVYNMVNRNLNCKECIYNSEHKGYFDGGFDCERYDRHIDKPEECICRSFVNTPMSLENAIDYLDKIGWMQEHDKALTENAVPVVRCKDCKWKGDTIGESWCDFHEFTILSDDDFCSYGEKKDDE